MSPARLLAVLLIVFGLGIALVGLSRTDAQSQAPPQLSFIGTEPAIEGCLQVSGWNLCDYSESAAIKTFYLRYKDYLGQPIAGFNAKYQDFAFGRVTHDPANPPEFRVQLDNLGLLAMQRAGLTPAPGSTPHPAVRDWLISIQEVGIDPLRVAGRTISQPLCDNKIKECVQYLDKQVFRFPETAVRADQVRREPVGLATAHPQVAQQPATTPRVVSSPLLFGLAGLLGLAGVVLLLRSREDTFSPQTI